MPAEPLDAVPLPALLQSALAATRRSPAMLALVLAFSTVLYLIVDLDRGQEGLFRISQQPLLDLQKSIQASIP